jgi:hypothetical protein
VVDFRPCELNARTIDQDVFDEAQQLNATRQLPQISEPPGRLRVSFEEPADKPTRKTSDYGLKRKQSFSRGFFRKLQPPSLEMTIDGNTDTLDYYLLPPTDEMLLNRRYAPR